MAAIVIDGKDLAERVKSKTAEAAKGLPRKPGLAVILVGDDPASRVYVTGKEKDCAQCGAVGADPPSQRRRRGRRDFMSTSPAPPHG